MTKDLKTGYKRTRLACYTSYFTMSSVFTLPLLFVTWRELYGLSYTLLGSLILVNFFTQLIIDFVFTGFSKYFNIPLVVRMMPIITSVGLLTCGLLPHIFPQYAYIGLLVGTIIFSLAAGLSEVLMSSIIAGLPSETPQKDMSRLHSLYGFGVLFMTVTSAIYFKIFGTHNWLYLILFFSVLPIISAVMFMTSPIPNLTQEASSGEKTKKRRKILFVCLLCIIFGSYAENTMSSWLSGYLEITLGLDKLIVDLLGTAGFAGLLALSRTVYAKYGKNITKVLLYGMIGSTICYVVAGVSLTTVPAFIACILVGVCSSMLWPGTLIMMEEKLPGAGVAAYALMAAGGDSGAAIAPQLFGIIADNVTNSEIAEKIGGTIGISVEQVGLRAGFLFTALVSFIGIFVIVNAIRYFNKENI